MSLKNYYYYDEENCEFVPVKYNQLERIVYTASVWLLCGVVLAGIGISILSFSIGTPAEIALKAENEALKKQLRTTQTTIDTLDQQVDQLAKADNEMYRSMLGLETIPMDERKAGTGGADLYSDFDIHSQETAEILKKTAQNLENLQRSISIQESSFEEIQSFYNENQKKMVHLPAIKPTQGDVVSGFGKRYHPILKYRRQHDGLDFKANIGDQIYATGNGVVKHAGRKGTYGRLLIIDHGYGYETYYAHLSSFAKDIRPGTRVERGQLVAYSGNTGMSSGPHLHYEIHKDGSPLDPLNFLFADVSPEEYSSYKRIAEQSQISMD
ncbi:peptidoglycan DD-metalloendopeptidase family protein [Aliifodinibius salicampi]|uniref:Peptidoglycan DD-metalloendopeptidase family protein n=1 Tax=Fodinibius salicampi TaxID=1920655 RepID=A0ABT3PX28_9BACT|nr:M23 family metallopeptidase [Fodinibius salicampi]MCW9712366.1 peptidoglycan DD-metalloendopeptidase family protein [Fodinibius salicampi]